MTQIDIQKNIEKNKRRKVSFRMEFCFTLQWMKCERKNYNKLEFGKVSAGKNNMSYWRAINSGKYVSECLCERSFSSIKFCRTTHKKTLLHRLLSLKSVAWEIYGLFIHWRILFLNKMKRFSLSIQISK